MNTRRAKRTNSGAADEPAAKRTATQQNGIANSKRDSIQIAQAAMDRLDFKTGYEICTEVLDSDPSSSTQSLLLGSICLERNGQVYEAAKQVEGALEGKETRESHLRATFNFLALALHHLEIARRLPPQEDEMTTSHLARSDLAKLKHEIKKAKDRQLKSPFDRLSSELFLKTMSYCTSPSLMMCSSVSRTWSQSIHGSTSLFRHFRMEGRISSIIKGLKTFGEESNNSLQSIDLKIKEEVTDPEKEPLHELILPSCGSLRSLSVAHNRELCKFIVGIASLCPALLFLSSTSNHANDRDVRFPDPRYINVSFLPSWNPKLRKLVWNGGRESLLCDDALLDRLQEATDVTICSQRIKSSFIVKLLSSNSSLADLNVPWLDKDRVGGLESISFDLPHLKSLYLEQSPMSTEDAYCSSFFKNFKAPNLLDLSLEKLNPKELSFLRPESSPRSLTVESLLVESITEETATSLIEAIKDWRSLRNIRLLLPLSTPSTFWNHFVRIITILSREAVEAGYQNHFLFPKLKKFVLGTSNEEDDEDDEDDEEPMDSSVSATALASMVSSRLAVRRGLSHRDVFFATVGDFDSSLSPPSGQDVAFASLQTSSVKFLDVNLPLTSEEKAISWLQDNVRRFRNDYTPRPPRSDSQDENSE